MTDAEKVCAALRREAERIGAFSVAEAQSDAAANRDLADFVEAAQAVRYALATVMLLTGEAPNALHGAAYDAALKRLAEVLG